MRTITVVDSDQMWPSVFEQLRAKVWEVLGGFAIVVEHVGSTTVPGLAAKPIIDMTVIVATDADIRKAIEQLAWRPAMIYGHIQFVQLHTAN